MWSSLRGRFIASSQTSHPIADFAAQYRHRSLIIDIIVSSQTSKPHPRHRSTTQPLQYHHRHYNLNTDTVLAMTGGQVGLFSET
jgi:hypothetical protein